MTHTGSRWIGLLLALMVLTAACGSTTEVPLVEDVTDQQANASTEQAQPDEQVSGAVADGPIAGLLTVQPSFGFGVFDVDPATGEARALPSIASVETVDRNSDLIVSGGAAYALGATPREGQSFASDISVVKIDYATGEVSQLVALGFDRETDDSDESFSIQLHAVAGNSVVVSSSPFGSGERTFSAYDATTGDQTASFAEPFYEFSSDTSSCSGGISNLIGLSDGQIAGLALNSPAYLDPASGEITLAIGCDQDDPQLADYVTVDQIDDYAIFDEGPAPTDDQIQQLLQTDLEPSQGFVEGNGDLWWIEADIGVVDEVAATVGGVVQFDLASGSVEAVHPLGSHLAEYLVDESFDVTTIEQAEMRYLDGQLVIVDGRENGAILVLDPTTGTITETAIEGDGADFTRTDLLAGDPENIWLEVTRFTVTGDDETGRTSSGPTFIEHFDLSTNSIDLSLATSDLFF